jgi:hypothetical protein
MNLPDFKSKHALEGNTEAKADHSMMPETKEGTVPKAEDGTVPRVEAGDKAQEDQKKQTEKFGVRVLTGEIQDCNPDGYNSRALE